MAPCDVEVQTPGRHARGEYRPMTRRRWFRRVRHATAMPTKRPTWPPTTRRLDGSAPSRLAEEERHVHAATPAAGSRG
eukprot:3528813-Lingulodinium_polyedra.AAC.1